MKILGSSIAMIAIAIAAYGSQVQSDYAIANIPAVLKARADAVVRNETINVDMQAQTKVYYQVKQAITVFNKGGEDKARLVIYYDKSTEIKRIAGRVFDADGFQTGKFTHRDFTDESAVSSFSLYEDNRVKYFLPAVTHYPYTVEYEYELELKQNLIIPAWRPDAYPDVAIQHSRYTFVCGTADKVRIKAMNYAGEPVRDDIDGRKVLTWEVSNLAARRQEPYSPDPDTYCTSVRVAPVDFVYYKHRGQYSDWTELGGWVYNALLADGLTLPENTIREVKQLVSDKTSDREKARTLYAYLQRKTRYVSVQIGIGGFKPTTASDVDRLGYGDCKGLVNYMQALLNVVGIPSYYCVVQAGSAKRDIQPDFAGMEQGNHIILCLPFENDTTWLECTSQRTPFGFLGSFTDDRTVFACTPNGGKLLRTPRYAEEANLQRREATLVLKDDGTLTGTVSTEFIAGQYDNHLEIAQSSGPEQMKRLKDTYDIDHISFHNIVYQKEESDTPILLETFDVTLTGYAPPNKEQVFLIPNVFNRRGTIPMLKNRTLPVYINRGYLDEDHLVFALPDGCTLTSGSWEETIDSPFGHYQATIEQKGNQLIYHRKFLLREGTFPADQYAEFSEFVNRIYKLDNRKALLATR
ncbi:DUF3857 domain-containing transglutaminase family protein [Parapedobacter sp. GCM10030251]|uniref:DUF3857 domain-containing transglutaminase family protein n=1 Tax=Parapedobacter sp. GCM10030251 TaxID=3273419 RepID=UPI003613A599